MRAGTVAALQAALAAENAAIFGYGVLGAYLAPGRRGEATRIWYAHRSRRDQLHAYIEANGGRPQGAAPAYRLPFRVDSTRTAEQLAARLEDGVVAGYAGLAGVDDAGLRRYAALAMQEAVACAVRWRHAAPSTAFPGLPASALKPLPEG
jgi:hypothetical protein